MIGIGQDERLSASSRHEESEQVAKRWSNQQGGRMSSRPWCTGWLAVPEVISRFQCRSTGGKSQHWINYCVSDFLGDRVPVERMCSLGCHQLADINTLPLAERARKRASSSDRNSVRTRWSASAAVVVWVVRRSTASAWPRFRSSSDRAYSSSRRYWASSSSVRCCNSSPSETTSGTRSAAERTPASTN
jgi:hypothetical protein